VNFFFVKAFDTMLERKWEIFSIRRIARGGSLQREIPLWSTVGENGMAKK
jgi:hypothetical protein